MIISRYINDLLTQGKYCFSGVEAAQTFGSGVIATRAALFADDQGVTCQKKSDTTIVETLIRGMTQRNPPVLQSGPVVA
jgi:hypothetical protein